MRSISIMSCDDMAGGAKRRVPLPERKANAKHIYHALRRYGRWREATRAVTRGSMTALLACLWRGVLDSYWKFINYKRRE